MRPPPAFFGAPVHVRHANARRVTAFSLRATTALIPLAILAAPAAGQSSQTPPTVITPPVGDFNLPPSGQTPAPRATATPAPAPSPIVQPVPIPTPTATRAATPRPTRTPAAAPSPAAVTPAAAPSPAATPSSLPMPSAVPAQAAPDAAPAPPVTGQGLPGWLWPALGAAGLLLAGIAGAALLRRRRGAEKVEEAPAPVAAAAPTPGPPPLAQPVPPARSAGPDAPAVPGASTAPALPAVPPPAGPLVTEIRPMRAAIRDGMVTLDLELFVQNRGAEPAENVRAVLALLGANAEQDAHIASFHGAARLAAGAEPFSVAPGAVQVMTVQVSLPGDQMQVVTVQGKPMFVPIVPVSLKWYAGLSIRTLRDAFMVGTAPAAGGDRLGPLWVERAGEGFGRLAAKRYVPKQA